MQHFIDPLNLSPNEEQILITLLQSKPASAVWRPGYLYPIDYPQQIRPEYALLTNYIVKVPSRKREYKYHVVDLKSLGSGAYGTVFPVMRIYRIEKIDGFLRLKWNEKPYGKRKVDKIVDTLKRKDAEEITYQEYFQNKASPGLSPKPLVKSGTELHAIMNRKEGKELYKILSDDRSNPDKQLKLEERFTLTISLLEALQYEVFDAGILHRDIKPENIRADIENGKTGFVDFNLSRIATNLMPYGKDAPGSYCYVAPEVFQHKGCSIQSDLFSTGRVIALIWGDINQLMSIESELERNIKKAISYARSNTFDQLFSVPKAALSGLKPQAKLIIRSTLQKMTAYNPRERIGCQEAIEEFKRAYTEQFEHHDKADEKKIEKRDLKARISANTGSSSSHKNKRSSVITMINHGLRLFHLKKSPSADEMSFAKKRANRRSC